VKYYSRGFRLLGGRLRRVFELPAKRACEFSSCGFRLQAEVARGR
jgi:hypothetical protein